MKILIGTPIHQVKDYSMERWLENVAKLVAKSPADLLLVDNSPNLDYVEKVKGYLAKYGIMNYRIKHFKFNQGMGVDEKRGRIEKSQEIISREILSGDYDAWFSWECDQIIPRNSLKELIKLMNVSNAVMVIHNSWTRGVTGLHLADFGVALISRECLKKFGSLLKFIGRADYPDMSMDRKLGDEGWFKKRVLHSGGNYIEASGVIGPIYHLDR